MNDYAFGNFLCALRNEKGLSQTQLGEMLGVTNKAVSKWENGSAKPNTSLIPKIAEIFGVTVEELFACKKLEKDSELEKIKQYLSLQKRKYAILSSVFLSVIITLPLFLIEFLCVVMGFGIPDDIIGPIGAVGFIFVFIISITAYIIYRKNFRHTLTPREETYSPQFLKKIRKGLLVSAIFGGCLFALLPFVYWLFLSFTSVFIANVFLSITIFVLILILAVFLCFANIKRLLKIKFNKNTQKKKIEFSELPKALRICYIAVNVLLLIVISGRVLSFFNRGLIPISILFMALYLACLLAVVIYSVKKK